MTYRLSVVAGAVLAFVAYGDAQTSSVSDPRPMMAAADKIQSVVGIPVNYEDPRFEFNGDTLDVTDTVVKNKSQFSGRVLIPRGGDLPLAADALTGSMTDASVLSMLSRMEQAHEARGYPGRFTVVQRESSWYIEPVAIRNAAGLAAPISSIMATKIRFPSQQKSAGEFLQLILTQVSQGCGFKVGIGAAPFAALANNVTLAAMDEPATTVLNRMVHQLSPNTPGWSYRLLFDPGLKYYMFNIEPVRVPVPEDGATATSPAPQGSNPLKGVAKAK